MGIPPNRFPKTLTRYIAYGQVQNILLAINMNMFFGAIFYL